MASTGPSRAQRSTDSVRCADTRKVPDTAWGAGEEWQDGYENLVVDLSEALDANTVGDVDDPDHFDDI